MKKWWNDSRVGVRVAFLTGGFLLIATLCTFVGNIIVNLPSLIDFVSDAQDSQLEPVSLRNLQLSKATIITANYTGKEFFILSPSCWEVLTDNDGTQISGQDYANAYINFVVLATKEKILIDEISIILDEFLPAPDNSQLTDYTIRLGQYFNPSIEYVDLGTIDIFPENVEFHPLNSKSIEVPAMEVIGFEILASFHQPGEYIFHVDIQVSDFRQNTQKLSSDKLTLNWVSYPDLGNIVFFDPIKSREINLGPCQ